MASTLYSLIFFFSFISSVIALPDYGYYGKTTATCKPTTKWSKTLTSTYKTTCTKTKTVPGPTITKTSGRTSTVTKTASITVPKSTVTSTYTTTKSAYGGSRTITITLSGSKATITSTITRTQTQSGPLTTATVTKFPSFCPSISVTTIKETVTLSASTISASCSSTSQSSCSPESTVTETITSSTTLPASTVTETVTQQPSTITVTASPSACPRAEQPAGVNLIKNGGFEDSVGEPVQWSIDNLGVDGRARAYVFKDPQRSESGENALQYDFDVDSQWGPAVEQPIYLTAHRAYRISFWYRATDNCWLDPTISRQQSLWGFDGLESTGGKWSYIQKDWTPDFVSGDKRLVMGTSTTSRKTAPCEVSVDDIIG